MAWAIPDTMPHSVSDAASTSVDAIDRGGAARAAPQGDDARLACEARGGALVLVQAAQRRIHSAQAAIPGDATSPTQNGRGHTAVAGDLQTGRASEERHCKEPPAPIALHLGCKREVGHATTPGGTPIVARRGPLCSSDLQGSLGAPESESARRCNADV